MAKEDFEEDYQPSLDEESDQDVEYDEDKSKTKKSKKRKRETRKQKKKKKKRTDDGPIESELIHDEEAERLQLDASESNDNSMDHVFEEIASQAANRRVSRKGDSQRDRLQQECDSQSVALLEQMREAAIKDEQLREEGGGPIFHKLTLCPTVRRVCSGLMMQQTLIADGLLEVFAHWLRGSTDRDLPPLQVRSTILDILLELPLSSGSSDEEKGITINDLQQSQLGKAVYFLASHQKEIPSNKEKANLIVQKWKRLINNIPDRIPRGLDGGHRQRQTVEEFSRVTDQKDPQFSTRARVPRSHGFDFIKKPKSKAGNEEFDESPERAPKSRGSRR